MLADFLREQGGADSASVVGGGLRNAGNQSGCGSGDRQKHALRPIPTPPPQADEPPSFAFLERCRSEGDSPRCFSRELPQTVAVVVAHLPPSRAAAVLQELPSALATDALERIAWLDEPAAEIQTDLIRELRTQLAPHLRTATADATSLARLSAVLEAMDYRQRQRVVLQLGEQNQALLDRLGLAATAQQPTSPREGVIAMRYRLDSSPKGPDGSPSRKKSLPERNEESVWLTFDDLLQFDDAALADDFCRGRYGSGPARANRRRAAADRPHPAKACPRAKPPCFGIGWNIPDRCGCAMSNKLVWQSPPSPAAWPTKATIELPASVRFAAAI